MANKTKEQIALEQHILFATQQADSYNKFHWFSNIFKRIKGLSKTESEFMEYKTAERTVRRFAEYDRQFPLDKAIIYNTQKNERIDEATIHIGMSADEYARSFHALALTVGKDIYFRNGAYRPETEEGRVLLAHELTHVAQNKESSFTDNATKEEKEAEAELNEESAKYNPDPIITKNVDGKVYSLKKSEWQKIKKMALEKLEKNIENAEQNYDEEKYLDLLLRYEEWLEREADTWLI